MGVNIVPVTTSTQAYVPAVEKFLRKFYERAAKDFPALDLEWQPLEVVIDEGVERQMTSGAELRTSFWSRMRLTRHTLVIKIAIFPQSPQQTDLLTETKLLYLLCMHFLPYAVFKDFNAAQAQGWVQYFNGLYGEFMYKEAVNET